jgi:hypothetical protein
MREQSIVTLKGARTGEAGGAFDVAQVIDFVER